jgi:hypothetical protein
MKALQKHWGQDTPLLRELYAETLEGLVLSQGVSKMRAKFGKSYRNVFGQEAREERARVTSTYLSILGVQREYEEEACMLDTEKCNSMVESWSPTQYDEEASVVHLRADAQSQSLCRGEGMPAVALRGPSFIMRSVPYASWRRALSDLKACPMCIELAHKADGTQEGSGAWFDERRERAALEDIRARTDAALRERLARSTAITPKTGMNLAAKQYKYGVMAQAARKLRLDQIAFEELCFTPEQREKRIRLQATINPALPEVLSEEQWLELLVSNFPPSMEMALNTGVLHHHYGDAALFMIEKALSEKNSAPVGSDAA